MDELDFTFTPVNDLRREVQAETDRLRAQEIQEQIRRAMARGVNYTLVEKDTSHKVLTDLAAAGYVVDERSTGFLVSF